MIADRLYRVDPVRYKVLYAWINRMTKERKSMALTLQAIRALDRRDGGENKAIDVAQYLGGALRNLEAEREARRLRKGRGGSRLGEVLDAALAKERNPEEDPDDAA